MASPRLGPRLLLLALLVELGEVSSHALDPARTLQQYTLTTWTVEDGLPQSSANSIVQAPDGYLYVATYGGLIRFDGAKVTPVVSDGSCGNRLIAVEVDRDGAIWVAGERVGVCRVGADGVLRALEVPGGGLVEGAIRLVQASQGGVWAASVHGLLHLTDRAITRWGPEHGLPSATVFSISEVNPSEVWVGTKSGLCILRGTACERPPWHAKLGDETVEAIQHTPSGRIWVATSSSLWLIEAGRPRRIPLPLETKRIRGLLEDRQGNLWLSLGSDGLARLLPRVEHLPASVAGFGFAIALREDREGNLWVGYSTGLAKLSDGRARGILLPNESSRGAVLPIVSDGAGGAWVGSLCAGLVHVGATGTRVFDTRHGLTNTCVWSLLADPHGRVWIGTPGDGLFLLEGERIVRARGLLTGEGLVRALALRHDGAILVGTDQGVFVHDPRRGGFEPVPATEGADVYFLAPGAEDTLWVGTRTGALVVGPGGTRRIDRASGLGHDLVRMIHREPNGVVWLGTYGGGLARIEGDQVVVIGRRHGLPDDVVSSFHEDSLGRVWMSGNLGVTRVEKSQLEDVAAGRRSFVNAELFDARDGMPSTETNGGGQPAGMLTATGELWIPTVAGVAVFDTRQDTPNLMKPPVHIERVTVDGVELDRRRPIVLPPDARNLEIHYTALSFRAPDRVRFRYRLEGFDDRWVDAGNRRIAYYPAIPAGLLTFHVIAANDDGVWNEEGARLGFRMTPRFVTTPWFPLLTIAIAVPLLLLALRLRNLVAAQRQHELERLVAVRTAELASLAALTERVNHAVRLEEVLEYLYAALQPVVPYDRLGLALIDDNRAVLRAVWSKGSAQTAGIEVGYEVPLDSTSLTRMLESGRPRIIDDLEAYLAEHPNSESTTRLLAEGIRSNLTCLLEVLGRPVGFLFLSSRTPRTYDDSHVAFLTQVARHLSLVVSKSKLYEDLLETKERLEEANRHLEALASADGLTGIANRRAFDVRLEEEWRRAIRARSPLSLLLLDVDFFKAFNDRHGHTAGDDCLRAVAKSLESQLRRVADLVSRFGGEELAVILPDTDETGAKAMAERMLEGIERLRIYHGASSVSDHVTVSIGCATVIPTPELRPTYIVERADEALYAAKRAGRNRIAHAGQ